jgi:phenylacetate-CoA ligase
MHRWLVWNVLFPLHEKAKGHPTFEILREMEKADRLPADKLEELRHARLRNFIDYTYAHVPYVRAQMNERGLTPASIREPKDLAQLPLMTKGDVRAHRKALQSTIAGKLSPFSTGGSTGDPLIFDLSKRRIASRVACRQRVSRWWGVSSGDSELALWGSPIEVKRQDRIKAVRDWLLRTRLVSAFEMDATTMSSYLDILERGHFRHIFAYPSAIYFLCLHGRKQGRNLRGLGLKVVFVTSEVLFPYQRELIVDTLNCPVANGYGGRDSGFIAHECPQGGMHLMADAVITEIVDSNGVPVSPGESGEIVITDLYSHEFPFLRYATGDTGVASERRCACGRALPTLERIAGRANDSIIAPDGRVINDQALVYILRNIEGIDQFRIRQKTVSSFHVQIVRNGEYRGDAEERLLAGWSQLLRSRLHVTFEYITTIPSEKSGKFRHVISDLSVGGNPTQMEKDDLSIAG